MRSALLVACLLLSPGCLVRTIARGVTRAESRELSAALAMLGPECTGADPRSIDDPEGYPRYLVQCTRFTYDCTQNSDRIFTCHPTPRSVVLAQVRLDTGCSLPMWIAGDDRLARIDACGASYLCEIHGTLAVCKQ